MIQIEHFTKRFGSVTAVDDLSVHRRAGPLDQVPMAAVMITVAMTTPFEAALPRAQADPTRKASRDRDWLAERYQEWSLEMDRIAADVLLDASGMSLDQWVRKLSVDIQSARLSQR